MRRHPASQVDASPHMSRWCERYHSIDPEITGGDAQSCLGTERCAYDGKVVDLSSEAIEFADKHLQRDLPRARLLAIATEPAHGHR